MTGRGRAKPANVTAWSYRARTPGHTAQDVSTVASTPDDVFACTHAWWTAEGPADDPLGSDAGTLHVSRDLLLSFATVIVPGHGAAFRPDHGTPR